MSLQKTRDQSKSNVNVKVECNVINPSAKDLDTCKMMRCSIMTGQGRSAIAVVSLQGQPSAQILAKHFDVATKTPFFPGQIRFGVWRENESEVGESVVVTPVTLDHFEIHCHGGPAAVSRIHDALVRAGAKSVKPPNDDLLRSEAIDVLSHCLTAKTAAIAMDQYRGAMKKWVERMLSNVALAAQEADRLLGFADWGTRLTTPFNVVLIGPPNVGKSSLLNAIVGYDRSITFDQAGTTRDVLTSETVIDGISVHLSDTAGIHASQEPIERQGIARAKDAAEQADLILRVTEPNLGPTESDSSTTLLVLNKADLLGDTPCFPDHLPTCATFGQGIPELLNAISKSLVGSFPPSGSPVPITTRQADLLRQIATSDPSSVTDLLHHLLG